MGSIIRRIWFPTTTSRRVTPKGLPPPAQDRRFGAPWELAAATTFLAAALPVLAQPPQRPADNATAARIADGVDKAQAGKLLDAVEQFQRVLDTAGDELVPVDRSWYTPARWVVHGQIARLPVDGLRLYRQRVDGQAAKRLDEAKKVRDDAGLSRLLADMFAAKATEEAILELARRSFERSDFDAAEHYWRMLLPATPADDRLLHFPDPKTPPAAIRARLVLVKLFRGDRSEAKNELDFLKEKFPNDAGLLAAETGKYVDILSKLLNDPTQTTLARLPNEPGWPTFAGSLARTGTNRAKLPYFWPDVPSWKVPLPFGRGGRFDGPPGNVRHSRSLAFYPIIGDGRAYVADGARVISFDLMTGKQEKAASPDGGEETLLPTRHDLRYTLTESDGIIYARLGGAALRAGEKPSFVVALGPPAGPMQNRPVLWRLEPPAGEAGSTQFEGSPVARSGRLYAAIWRLAGAEAQAGIACYRLDDPKAAPELVWQRLVGKASSEPNGETRYRHSLVTFSGPNVVYCTDGGSVIALNATTGQPAWEYRYPRNERPTLPRYRDLCPPLADGGRIYAAPADTDRLLCLDAATGRMIWEREGVEVIHLLGVARGRLIATFGGVVRGIRGLNLWTGADSGAGGWTIHDPGGEGTFGRGLVTEEVVVWPTRHGLRFLDPADGTQLRSPIPGPTARLPDGTPLPAQSPEPFGNLCYVDGVLLVTTPTEVWGFVSEAKKLGDRRKTVEADPDNPAKHADLTQSLIDAGQYAEAETEAAKAGEAKDRLRWLLAECLIRDGKRDAANRLYEELAKGDGAFAAAGAARLAKQCRDPDQQFKVWDLVRWKRGSVRDSDSVPWPARTYAEEHSPVPLLMGRPGNRGEDLDPYIEPDRFLGHLSGIRLSRSNSVSFFDPSLRVLDSSEAGILTTGERSARFPDDRVLPTLNAATLGEASNGWNIAASPEQILATYSTNPSIWWTVDSRTDAPILARTYRRTIPSASGVSDAPKVSAVSFGRRGVSFVVGGRSIALISRNAIDEEVYTLPGGHVGDLRPVHSFRGVHLVSQTADGRMVIFSKEYQFDSRPSSVRTFRSSVKPWPEPPPFIDADRCLIPDDGSVFLFDAKAGKELARYTLPGPENLTGELPRFRVHQGDPLLIIDRNYGVEVDRLRIDGLRRAWERSPVFVGRSLDDVAFVGDQFFTAADGVLAAHGWKDGNPVWEAPLPELVDGKWKVAVAPQGLLAYPSEAVRRHPDFDALGEFRRAGWNAAALLRAVGHTYDVWADRELPVLVIDPADGRLVQRLNFPAAGPAAGVAVTPKGVVVVTGKGSWTLTVR